MTSVGSDSYSASTQLRPVVSVSLDEKTIKLRGCKIGQIAGAGSLQHTGGLGSGELAPSAYRDCTLEFLQKAVLPLQRHFPDIYPTREDLIMEFAEVITGNGGLQYVPAADTSPAVRRKSLRDTWTEFEARALDPAGDFSIACTAFKSADGDAGQLHPIKDPQFVEIAIFFRNLVTALTYFCFGVLRDGHLGLFASGTRLGDHVVVFNGAETPFVLRACEPSEGGPKEGDEEGKRMEAGSYGLVGDCYVHGFMNGETLQAPYVERKKWFTLV